LKLYMQHDGVKIKFTDNAIVELSRLLRKRAEFLALPHDDTFRSIDSIYIKLQNLKRFDPNYHGRGLSAGNKMEEEIWNLFASDKQYLKDIAESIIVTISQQIKDDRIRETDPEEDGFPEGNVLYRIHRFRERNIKLVNQVKKNAVSLNKFYCEICGFSFPKTYGELGKGYIECHHTLPLSEYKSITKTAIKDIALVCSNCHRMLHRRRPWLRMEEIFSIISNK
jgi:5-methylcytosine-specific restriction enzyme A